MAQVQHAERQRLEQQSNGAGPQRPLQVMHQHAAEGEFLECRREPVEDRQSSQYAEDDRYQRHDRNQGGEAQGAGRLQRIVGRHGAPELNAERP